MSQTTLLTTGSIAMTLLLGGCPAPAPQAPVEANISINLTHAPAPVTVVVSAADSTSTNGGTLQYSWTLGDDTTADTVSVTHTYTHPGRYVIRLRVTDETGESDTAAVEVRAEGTGATAVIGADKTSGPAPLLVSFDGTDSTAPDDVIHDYFWNFGDGTSSNASQPTHLYSVAGEYEVTLRVVTAGGVEATTHTTITAGVRTGSLQFAGSSYATLPLAATGGAIPSLTNFTMELWVRAESDGGNAFSLADGDVSIDVIPATNTVRLQIQGTTVQAAATTLSDNWRHIALVYNGDDGSGSGQAAVFVGGASLMSLDVTGAIAIDRITLGNGYRGRISEVRFWEVARDVVAIQGNMNKRLTGTPTGLLGYWRLDEGTGQILANRGTSAVVGVLGGAVSAEPADPAWSSDSPF